MSALLLETALRSVHDMYFSSPFFVLPSTLPCRGVICVGVVAFCAIFGGQLSVAQNSPSDPGIVTPSAYYELQQRAISLYDKALSTYDSTDFAVAVEQLEKAVGHNPRDGKNWIRLGDSRYYTGDYRGAIDAYQEARTLGYGFLDGTYRFMDYSIASSYAELGNKTKALAWFERSLQEERFPARRLPLQQDAFSSFHESDRLRSLAGLAPEQSFDSHIEGWRYDLQFLLSEVRRLNATYSERPLPDSIQRAADQLRADIPKLSDGEIWVRFQQLLAKLGQSHNSVWHFEGAERLTITQLPLSFYLFEDGLHVMEAEQKGLIGAKVQAIGGTPTDQALNAVRSVVTSETRMKVEWLGPLYLRMPQVLCVLGIINDTSQVELTLESDDGSSRQVSVEPVPVERRKKIIPSKHPNAGTSPLYLSHPDEPYWMEEQPNRGLTYVQVNQIRNEEEESFADFAVRLRETLNTNDTSHLVVDLRRNNGGDTFLYTELLRTLVWFDVKAGTDLYVVVGRNTYSAAQNLATDLDRFTDAVFVGEPTGGRPNTHGDESHVILPYSGLHVGLSASYWQQSHPRDGRQWIAPEIPVSLSSGDYFGNRDPVMRTLRKVIGER